MSKQEKFDVTVAAFEALLKERNLREEYFVTLNLRKFGGTSKEIYTDWKKWALQTQPYGWIECAFVWENTPLGYATWKNLDYAWLKWILRNLNN